MAYTTTWHVLNMQRETSDGYVFDVAIQLAAVDNDDSSKRWSVNQSVHLERPEALGIAYSDLTESKVLEWCKQILDTTQMTPNQTYTQFLEEEIKRKMEDGLGNGLPWLT
tara:strand:+ start:465 stop:794 length:330 start_codon:yes stop_codon:yes gene_type:complete